MLASQIGKPALYQGAIIEGEKGQSWDNQREALACLSPPAAPPPSQPRTSAEIPLLFNFSPIRSIFYCPFLLPTHDWINSITLEKLIHIQAVKKLRIEREEKRQRNPYLPNNKFHLEEVWKQFSLAFVPVRSHYSQMKFTKYQFNFNKGAWIPTHEGWIYQIITLEGTLVASKYFPVRGNQKQTAEY